MNRRLFAGTLTAGLLGLILGIGARRRPAGRGVSRAVAIGPDGTPEARLRSLIEDARDGDVDGYLDAFAEPLRSRIAREADEVGRTAFAAGLRRASEARKGYALHAPVPDGPDAVRIALEAVYPDRNERQVYRLERAPDGWRIAGVEAARGPTPASRFGTLATYKEPEGVPVEGIEPPGSPEEPGP
jgi:hypothetical protein